MTKSERLIYLLNYLNPVGRVSLRELASNSKTSERTIYRDIKELTKIGYPIDFDGGYYLKTSAPHSILNKLTESELRMIKFALETHPLGKIFPFNELAAKLKCPEILPEDENESRLDYNDRTINRMEGFNVSQIPDPFEGSKE